MLFLNCSEVINFLLPQLSLKMISIFDSFPFLYFSFLAYFSLIYIYVLILLISSPKVSVCGELSPA